MSVADAQQHQTSEDITTVDPALSPTRRWAALLVASGRGEEESFETLVHEVRGRLRASAIYLLRDPHDAEEVVQEALIEAWRNAHRYDPLRGHPITWLHQIVRHRAIDLMRRRVVRRSHETRVSVCSAPVDFDHTFDSVLANVDQETVRAALDDLTDLQREAVLLVYFVGLTNSEAAARLAIPVATLKTRLRDGIGRLRTVVTVV